MATEGTRGVSALADLLSQLSAGEPVRAAQFAEQHGYARSSIFDLARRMQETGFLVRDVNGALLAGPATYDLAWSSHGLSGLRGPAEAVLVWLCDHADSDAVLYADDTEILAVGRPVSRSSTVLAERTASICDDSGAERLNLVWRLREHVASRSAEVAFRRACATLEQHLKALG
ncbi:MAG: hypothetical protein WBF87_07360 [Mesorhizobium sp.]